MTIRACQTLRILKNVGHIALLLAKDGQENSMPRVKILRIGRRFREAGRFIDA
ncbi:MAG: hypothetical protein ACLPQ0_05860 [Candidatus Binatus sp.]